jgi:zinc and cadmium transporter
MPDAMELSKDQFGWWMSLGAVGLFLVERFIAPHSHEVESKLQSDHDHDEHCAHDHKHEAAPSVAGWMAVVGLTIHTFMNGVALGGQVDVDLRKPGAWVPGLAVFLAIALHKPADALAISTVLSRKGVSRGRISLVQLGFACMVPVGAGTFLLMREAIQEGLRNQLTGAALAFSAGTFLFIALSDLLPEVQFHRHDRVPLSVCLILGVVLMGGIAILEDMGKEDTRQSQEAGAVHPEHPDKHKDADEAAH